MPQTLQQFGQTIKAKYPQYADIPDEELGSKMISKYPQYKDLVGPGGGPSARDKEFDQGKLESMMDNGGKGLFDISVLGGILRGAAHPLLQAGNMAAEMGNAVGHEVTNPQDPYKMQFLSPSQNEAMNPNSPTSGIVPSMLSGAKTGVGTGIDLAGGNLLKSIEGANLIPGSGIASAAGNKALAAFPVGAGYETGQANSTPGSVLTAGTLSSIAYPLLSMLKSGMLTKGGGARKATEAAGYATDEGLEEPLTKLQRKSTERVLDKFGDTPAVRDSLSKVLTPEDTGQLDTRPLMKNPSQILDWRRQITNREGGNIFQNVFKGSDLDQKVAREVRDTLAEQLHKMAPGTILPDQVYSLYSKLGGDIPRLLLEVLGAGGILGAGAAAVNAVRGH